MAIKRFTNQYIYELEKSITWARALQPTVDLLASEGQIDLVSKEITHNVARPHWFPAVLLALTCCRFAELEKINLSDIIAGKPQSIREGKTHNMRLLPNLWIADERERSKLDASAKIIHSEYPALKSAIHRATPRHIREKLKDQNDGTHIFRHLRASFFADIGWSTEMIQEFFAHKNADATRKYIHEGLFPRIPKAQT